MDKEILTLKEASEYLRTHPDTIYKLARNGEIPGFKLGKNWRFRRASIEEWFKQQEQNKQNNKKLSV